MKKLSGAVFAAALLIFAGTSIADDDNDDENNEAKYRHSVMESMGYSFGSIAQIFTKRVDRPDELVVHAQALAKTASLSGGLFPAGSEGGDALPLAWEEPEKVAAASQEMADATAALAKAAEGGNPAEIAKAFKAAGASCKACHEKYKEEDD